MEFSNKFSEAKKRVISSLKVIDYEKDEEECSIEEGDMVIAEIGQETNVKAEVRDTWVPSERENADFERDDLYATFKVKEKLDHDNSIAVGDAFFSPVERLDKI